LFLVLLSVIENVAAVQFMNPSFAGITAGSPFTITWQHASGPVTITLMNGGPTDLTTVSIIASMYCIVNADDDILLWCYND
jgi:hypothetical protein